MCTNKTGTEAQWSDGPCRAKPASPHTSSWFRIPKGNLKAKSELRGWCWLVFPRQKAAPLCFAPDSSLTPFCYWIEHFLVVWSPNHVAFLFSRFWSIHLNKGISSIYISQWWVHPQSYGYKKVTFILIKCRILFGWLVGFVLLFTFSLLVHRGLVREAHCHWLSWELQNMLTSSAWHPERCHTHPCYLL